MKTSGCIDKSKINGAFAALGKTWDVFAPVRDAGSLDFRLLPAEGAVFLGSEKTLLPLKTLFLPPVEDIFQFREAGEGTALEAAPSIERDRVVFGALGCDVAALELLDNVLLDEPADEAYKKRRERTTVVALACTGEGPECFCKSFGIDPVRPSGADAVLTDAGDAFLFEPVTDKGSGIAGALGNFLREATDEERGTAALNTVSRSDVPHKEVPENFADAWDIDLWGELAARCVGCGVCTLLCPTCYCFDVRDEKRGTGGTRFKAWDSCMFVDFTRMAGGDNPRGTKRQRVRQRFLHKLLYYPSKYERSACVGCGRCTRRCPVGIGIDEVITRLASTEVRNG
jgi:ferredoxin